MAQRPTPRVAGAGAVDRPALADRERRALNHVFDGQPVIYRTSTPPCAAEALYWLGRDSLVGTWAGVDVERRGAEGELQRVAGDPSG